MLLRELVRHRYEVITFADYYAGVFFGLAELEVQFEDYFGLFIRVLVRMRLLGLERSMQARRMGSQFRDLSQLRSGCCSIGLLVV